MSTKEPPRVEDLPELQIVEIETPREDKLEEAVRVPRHIVDLVWPRKREPKKPN